MSAVLLFVGLFLWNTYSFFLEYKIAEQQKMNIWATAQTQFLAADPNVPMGDLVLKIFQSNKQTPMLLEQADGSFSFNNFHSTPPDNAAAIKKLKEQFSSENTPIQMFEQGTLLATLYYGEPPSLKKLRYYPLGLIVFIGLFGMGLYVVFKLDKRAAQNILWASMAKETAHQIATPLSALLAWNSLLKDNLSNGDIPIEIDKDLARLSIISSRFSTIGNHPVLEPTDLIATTQQGIAYLKNRLSKSIDISLETNAANAIVPLNKSLYFWCLENLIKNSIDAMKGTGLVCIRVEKTYSMLKVHIIDQGQGIAKKDQKNIFNPGFSTKKSGWGMGLSLVKRIVEEYHKGLLYLEKTSSEGSEIIMEFPLK